ncbi:DNA-3-methyladenine glycosylase 2 family protein [Halorussus gelatinilyticus]|uniref:DNA-3-methyladenine glycosylase 2 family protein n=1 Tax=Halorussus gelatinilyticus TaxID=2937524 RepID=A0A8U0IH08_9EURY|nr:DNA-3-methyladenine glycosylase 2 family protein [Halorussus gelatinilyticus]UPW00380.1 DNA-3-methyladenine glycosylase 2 family protein [Halorussus gelatinilyticus]
MTDEAIAALRGDDYLGPLVAEYGPMTIEPAENFYERFVVSILRQQVSMASAAATRERLFDRVEPTPEAMLAADPEVLRDAGLSRQKTEYVRNVAEAFLEEGYSQAYFAGVPDEEVLAELTSIKGVGAWTANMQLMFSLGRPDVFPVGDLGIRKGMERLFDAEMTRAEMVETAERWAPYRSYASLYLWRADEDITESVGEVSQR